MTTIDILRAAHIAAGAAALASFWIPMVTPKGARTHRWAGWVFIAGMAIVSVSAILLSGLRLAGGAQGQSRLFAIFLGYLGVITGEGVWKAVRVLRTKSRTARTTNPLDLLFAGAVLLLALPTLAAGLAYQSPLVISFGGVGLFGGWTSFRYWWRAPQDPMHWWFEHMGATIGTSIAAITAFLVLNSARLGLGQTSMLVWLGPTIVGVPLLVVWQAYYRARFAPRERRAA
jgi:uncharacterized membrane protein